LVDGLSELSTCHGRAATRRRQRRFASPPQVVVGHQRSSLVLKRRADHTVFLFQNIPSPCLYSLIGRVQIPLGLCLEHGTRVRIIAVHCCACAPWLPQSLVA